jgi:hypothetical protein
MALELFFPLWNAGGISWWLSKSRKYCMPFAPQIPARAGMGRRDLVKESLQKLRDFVCGVRKGFIRG